MELDLANSIFFQFYLLQLLYNLFLCHFGFLYSLKDIKYHPASFLDYSAFILNETHQYSKFKFISHPHLSHLDFLLKVNSN